jgi:MFS family permease
LSNDSHVDVSKATRWFFLILVSVTIGTNYYAYDALSSIKDVLHRELGIGETDYGLIVGMYAFPNTFLAMAVIGGIILDRLGIRKTGFMFTLLCALGVALTAYGASDQFRQGGPGFALLGAFWVRYSPVVKMMVLGRLLFGLGAETSIVVINKVIAKWFKEKELAFAFAINLSIARLGTASALLLSPFVIEAAFGWTLAAWVAAMAMTIGFLFFIVYNLYDRRYTPERPKGTLLDPDEVFQVRDIFGLLKNPSYLFIVALCVTFYSAIFPFQAFCPDFLHHKFALSYKLSGGLSSVIIWGTIVFNPIFGYFVDKRGKRASLMVGGSALLLISHVVLALSPGHAAIAVAFMFVLGIAFSLVPASMWPSVALIVEEKRLGTGYGLMTSIQNFGLWAFPILAGFITGAVNKGIPKESPKDYTYTILMFAALGLAGLLFAFLLKRADRKATGRLEHA